MPELLFTIGSFLVAILLLVTVHEFGHYWVARQVGVKVLRFSIGFGNPLLRWYGRKSGTEFAIAPLPLGGYVKMLDEREESVDPAERHLAFNNQRLWKRSLVVAAGPAANLLFAILIYWGILIAGETGSIPRVGTVVQDSVAAEAGFEPGDLVTGVDDREIQLWSNFWFAMLSAGLSDADVVVQVVDADGIPQSRILTEAQLQQLTPGVGFLAELGLGVDSPEIPAVIGEVLPDEPAARAGLRSGDRILEVDGAPIANWRELVSLIQQSPGDTLALGIERDGRWLQISLSPTVVQTEIGEQGRIGAGPRIDEALFEPFETRVSHGPLSALDEATYRVWDLSVVTLKMLGRMLVGQASLDNLSSPIGIADAAGKTASFGFEPFAKFLALLSISLGLLNLLPIPVLDGGHLVYFAIEGLRGKPLSETVMAVSQRIGLALILGLMGLAFYVDLTRMLG